MVTPGGLAKILDFGLAKLAELDKEETLVAGAATIAVTHKGLILGTVGYMSPEQASGRTADFASDQFSLGTILYEMVTGNRAFARETAVETLTAIIRDEPAPIAEINRNVPAPFRWIVDRCLAKEPADRYADTTDLARELRTLQDHLSDASVLNLSARVRRPKHLGRIAAAVTVTALLTVAGFLMGWQANAPQPIKVSQLTFRRGHAQHGRFAPNGSIVYNANWAGQPVGLFTTNTEAPESRSLGNANSGLFAVSRNGELAIAQNCVMNWGVCGGTLARVPLSGGTPKAVEEGVDSADWRPDGESFVMARAVHGKYQIQEYPSGKMLYESAGWIADLRVSPRGDWIAFAEHPALRYSYGSVVVIDSAGRNKQVLSGTWRSIMGLAWHPDGNRIWFSASIKGDGPGSGQESWIHEVTLSGKERDVYRAPSTLYVEDISADGRQVLVLRQSPRAVLMTAASDAGLERDVAWFNSSTLADLSSDGKTLLFDEELVTGAAGLVVYVRDSDGSDAVRVGEGRALALSPDKRWALAIQQMTPLRLALLPVGPGQPRAMDTGAMAEVYWATWFPDGSKILLAGTEGGRGANAEAAHLPRTWVYDLATGITSAVTSEGMLGVLVSPDGQSIAARYQADGLYYLCPLKGSLPHALEGAGETDNLVQWSKDGRSLYVRGPGDFVAPIYLLDLETGRKRLWKTLAPAEAGIIGIGSDPKGVRVTPDGKHYAYTYWTSLSELYILQGLK